MRSRLYQPPLETNAWEVCPRLGSLVVDCLSPAGSLLFHEHPQVSPTLNVLVFLSLLLLNQADTFLAWD